jgi:hypothetical protein
LRFRHPLPAGGAHLPPSGFRLRGLGATASQSFPDLCNLLVNALLLSLEPIDGSGENVVV